MGKTEARDGSLPMELLGTKRREDHLWLHLNAPMNLPIKQGEEKPCRKEAA